MKSVQTVLSPQISKSSEDIVKSLKNKNEKEQKEINLHEIIQLIQMDEK